MFSHRNTPLDGYAALHVYTGANVARRFTGDQRPTLLLTDRDRLRRICGDPARPVQFVFAGRAHPASIASLAWRFNADRMMMDYAAGAYRPAAGALSLDMRHRR